MFCREHEASTRLTLWQTFADELHYQQFIAFIQSDDAIKLLEEEEKFCDAANTKLVVMRREVSIGERAHVQKLD